MSNRFNRYLGSQYNTQKGNMADFQHASRLYVDDNFRLAPRTKFLYYAVFNINREAIRDSSFGDRHKLELNYLVKRMDLPKYSLQTENLNQYNRKTTTYTSIAYDPINLTFHDDNNGVTNSFWALYYGYYFQDRFNGESAYAPRPYKNKPNFRYGLDTDIRTPFFNSIELFTLSRHKFHAYLICNPRVTSWQHDQMDQTDGAGIIENQMTLAYDAVIYSYGKVSVDDPSGFAVLHYDTMPSPLKGSSSQQNSEGIFGDVFTLDRNISERSGARTISEFFYENQGNLSPFGRDVPFFSEVSREEPANTTSGFSNFDFGNRTTSRTEDRVEGVTSSPRFSNKAPIEPGIRNSTQEISRGINQQFSGVSSTTSTPPVAKDVFEPSLPRNSQSQIESQTFNNTNPSRTLPETQGPTNTNNFSSRVSSERQELRSEILGTVNQAAATVTGLADSLDSTLGGFLDKFNPFD
jgi:hypothetical protein